MSLASYIKKLHELPPCQHTVAWNSIGYLTYQKILQINWVGK